MKRAFSKPKVFSSKCLGFAACRWNGVAIPDPFIENLKGHVEFITTCPEVEIGLGIPRDPIRIIKKGNTRRLIQPNTGKDVTEAMKEYVSKFLDSLGSIDGFILKDRSPSCGTSGFFGEEVLARFPKAAIETETRLLSRSIRKRFLMRLFGPAGFRRMEKTGLMKDII